MILKESLLISSGSNYLFLFSDDMVGDKYIRILKQYGISSSIHEDYYVA